MMKELLNAQKGLAQQVSDSKASTRHGIVSSYDPNAYAVKVTLQPDGVVTGWLPLKSIWVGQEWGLFCPPSIGDAVEIDYQEGDRGVGSAGLRFFNDQDRPLPCPSGEFWMVHKSGSLLKFHNDGTVELTTASDLNATVGGSLNASVSGDINSSAAQWTHQGPLTVNGKITGTKGMAVSGGGGATVSGNMTVTSGDVTADSISLKSHVHGGVSPGGGTTGSAQ